MTVCHHCQLSKLKITARRIYSTELAEAQDVTPAFQMKIRTISRRRSHPTKYAGL